MTISLKHEFFVDKIDGGDASLVQPSNWNEEHVLIQASGVLLGRSTADEGPTEEISLESTLALVAGSLGVAEGSIDTPYLANDGVTYDKIQNVSAQYRILGRVSASAGNVEEITTSAFIVSRLADADAATFFAAVKQAGSESATGVFEKATTAEAAAKTADKAITADRMFSPLAPVAITSGATPGVDIALGRKFTLTFNESFTLQLPTNCAVGDEFVIHFTEGSGSGVTPAYASGYKGSNGILPTINNGSAQRTSVRFEVTAVSGSTATEVLARPDGELWA